MQHGRFREREGQRGNKPGKARVSVGTHDPPARGGEALRIFDSRHGNYPSRAVRVSPQSPTHKPPRHTCPPPGGPPHDGPHGPPLPHAPRKSAGLGLAPLFLAVGGPHPPLCGSHFILGLDGRATGNGGGGPGRTRD
jgi:hypothetical protein